MEADKSNWRKILAMYKETKVQDLELQRNIESNKEKARNCNRENGQKPISSSPRKIENTWKGTQTYEQSVTWSLEEILSIFCMEQMLCDTQCDVERRDARDAVGGWWMSHPKGNTVLLSQCVDPDQKPVTPSSLLPCSPCPTDPTTQVNMVTDEDFHHMISWRQPVCYYGMTDMYADIRSRRLGANTAPGFKKESLRNGKAKME